MSSPENWVLHGVWINSRQVWKGLLPQLCEKDFCPNCSMVLILMDMQNMYYAEKYKIHNLFDWRFPALPVQIHMHQVHILCILRRVCKYWYVCLKNTYILLLYLNISWWHILLINICIYGMNITIVQVWCKIYVCTYVYRYKYMQIIYSWCLDI